MASTIREFKINTSKHKNFRIMIEDYASAYDVAEDCNTRPRTSTRFDDMRKKSIGQWEGVKSYDHALELLKNGYVDNVKEIQKSIKKGIYGVEKRIKFKNDVQGFAPVVPLAILGVPQSMINTEAKLIKTKVIDLVYDMTCPAYVDTKDMIKAGIAFLEVISKLEMQGYRINLKSVQCYTSNEEAYILSVNIKNSRQPLDLKRISFPTMHTAFFRVIGFDWYSKTPRAKCLPGYGHNPTNEFNNKGELKEFATSVFGKNAVYIPIKNFINMRKEDVINEITEVIQRETKINSNQKLGNLQ